MSTTTLTARDGARILADTFWMDLPEPILGRVIQGARVRQVEARSPIFGLGDPAPRAGILLEGTARSFLAAADGRQLTVCYARRGALLTRRSYLLGGHSPIAIHAVTDVELLELDARPFLRQVETEVAVAGAVLAELGRRLEDVYATVADSAFGTVKEKVARHLLALSDDGHGGQRTVTITQQDLADAIGSMREVVARALRELRQEGIVATAAGSIKVLDPARLAAYLGAWQVAASPDLAAPRDLVGILEDGSHPIVAVDLDGAIVQVNSLAEAAFGWPRQELRGQNVEVLIPERLADLHRSHRASWVVDPIPRPMSRRTGLRARRRDGSEFPVAIGISTFENGPETLILATVVEIEAG
jgi:CRP/FNR family transcriptional regulator